MAGIFAVKTKQIFYFGNSEEKGAIMLCVCVCVTVFKKAPHPDLTLTRYMREISNTRAHTQAAKFENVSFFLGRVCDTK